MKLIIALLFIVNLSVVFAQEKSSPKIKGYDDITIISDLDDTIKITNVGDTSDMIINGIFREKLFAGSVELYRALVPNNRPYYIVSGSIKYLRSRIEDTLDDNRMPKAEIILKELHDGNTRDYKIRKIKKIISETSGSFILLGDDTEYDPDVLLAIKSEFPERVIGTYIRSIRGRTLEAPLKSYLTVYEVAYEEVKAGRMDKAALPEIEETLLKSKEKLLLPPYISCELYPELSKRMSSTLSQKVKEICHKKEFY